MCVGVCSVESTDTLFSKSHSHIVGELVERSVNATLNGYELTKGSQTKSTTGSAIGGAGATSMMIDDVTVTVDDATGDPVSSIASTNTFGAFVELSGNAID